jgi:hypothetical protein
VYCTNCSKEYNEKMNFCVICGQPLTASPVPTEFTAVPETASAAFTEKFPEPPPDGLRFEEADETPAPFVTPAPAEPMPSEPGSAGSQCAPLQNPAPDTLAADETAIPIEKQYAEVDTETPEDESIDDDKTEIVEIKKKPKIKIFRNIPAAVASVMIGVLLFSLILVGGISAAVRYATYPENIQGMVEAIDVLSLPTPPEFEDIINVDADNLGEAVYTFAEPTGLTKDDIEYIYENATFREGFASILTGYAGFLRDGIVPPDITANDIKALFDDNLKVMNEAFGEEMSDYDVEVVYANIELSSELLGEIDLHSLTSGRDQTLNVIRTLISYPTFVAEAAIILLLLILIARMNKKAAPALVVSGVAGVSAALLTALSVLLFSNEIIGLPDLQKSIIGGVLSYLAPVIYIGAAAVAFIGIIFIIIGRLGSPRVN